MAKARGEALRSNDRTSIDAFGEYQLVWRGSVLPKMFLHIANSDQIRAGSKDFIVFSCDAPLWQTSMAYGQRVAPLQATAATRLHLAPETVWQREPPTDANFERTG